MNKLFIIFLLFLSACSTPNIDRTKSKTLITSFLELLKKHQYDKIGEYYAVSFLENEPLDVKIPKLKEIETASGDIKSFEFISCEQHNMEDGTVELEIKYKVKCKNTTLMETFVIVSEEGNYKIARQIITNKE